MSYNVRNVVARAAALLIATSVGMPQVALADASITNEVVARHVSTRGLDLANAGDLVRLRGRVRVAIRSICGEQSATDLEQSILVDRCRRVAALSAEPQIAALVRRDTQYAAIRAGARGAI